MCFSLAAVTVALFPMFFASTDPGDLFVMRNIGNLVPPFEMTARHSSATPVAAAIEFSLLTLNVNHIVVCGHSDCGAMRFFTHPANSQSAQTNLAEWLTHAVPSFERFKACCHANMAEPHNVLSKINVLQQLDHLKNLSHYSERLNKQTLQLHGWWFELAKADVYQYEADKNDFILIDAAYAEKMLKTL